MRHARLQSRDPFFPVNRPGTWASVQPNLTVGAPADRHEMEADRAADAVINGAPVRIGTTGPASVRRDPPTAPPQQAGAGEALGKLGEAFLKTPVGKQLMDAAEKLGKDFVATLPGKIVTGAAAVATIAELAREHKGLPMQPPAVPLDFLAPGMKAQLRIEGPIDHPSAASISFSIPLGGTAPAGPKPPGPTKSEAYRAETAKMQHDFDIGKPKPANDPAMDAYTQQHLKAMSERLIPGLRQRSATGIQPEKKDEGAVQRKAEAADGGSFAAPASVEGILASGGEPLPPTVQSQMSSRFGRDFSGVRVHTDDRAAASTTAIGARAYAYHDHLVFGRGQYAPARRDGQWLLAHELAHVAQQAGGSTSAMPSRIVVGRQDDPLERQADHAAKPVMDMPDGLVAPTAAVPRVMRKCEACKADDEAEKLHAKPLQSGLAETDEAPGIVHQVLQSGGEPLDGGTREFFEPRFGRDFSGVRLHTDQKATSSARQVGARAYSVGNAIAFGVGEWSPGTRAGRNLIAHELAHVVQHERAPTARLRRDSSAAPALLQQVPA